MAQDGTPRGGLTNEELKSLADKTLQGILSKSDVVLESTIDGKGAASVVIYKNGLYGNTIIGALNFNAEDAENRGLTIDQFAALKILAELT